ncbi:S8 family serine peptidase [Sporosarcina sp. ACRSL]|uniref:S8 family peptidase n=1 Tax=Sporosarcina sp. ACRSL TaxID=2918215 RepID=UPI001EF5E6C1|nr:S8 family serine peptidase [Sporosarcina sp. ACRSL]MCG7344067.1 S8 family serine peptidase [Sporosarcina sp. ACRSL]
MKKIVWTSILSLLLAISLTSQIALANESDRVIVELLDKDNELIIESVHMDELEELPDAKVLQPDYIREIAVQAGTWQAKSWGPARIGAGKLIELTQDIEGIVIVAVIDTGVDLEHPLLRDRLVVGYDVLDKGTAPTDEHFHGTHMAGIIADSTPANVKIMPIRAVDKEGRGYDYHIAEGIRYAVDNGADVINMSFVGEEYSTYLAEAITYALQHDVVVVVASGNESTDTAPLYPAGEEKVIVVGAVDRNNRIADFSNTGASIDIVAPGVDILSSVPGGSFKSYSGTSTATPFVSGIAAMLKLEDPTRTVQEIDRLLKKYSVDQGPAGWDPQFGEGTLNFTSYDEQVIQQVSAPLPKTSSDMQSFPSHDNVPLNKSWKVTFDRALTEGDKVDIRIIRSGRDVPIVTETIANEIIVTPIRKLFPHMNYQLLLFVENGGQYEMKFRTGE